MGARTYSTCFDERLCIMSDQSDAQHIWALALIFCDQLIAIELRLLPDPLQMAQFSSPKNTCAEVGLNHNTLL